MSAQPRIVLGSSLLADYPEGGGHWSAYLQFMLGLDALGVDVYWFEALGASDRPEADRRLIRIFLRRFAELGFRSRAAVLYGKAPENEELSLDGVKTYGLRGPRVADIVASADAIWNFCGAFPGPILSKFGHRVLIDTDPGVYQLSAADWDMGLSEHDAFMTIGLRIGEDGSEIPTAGVRWRRFRMPIHLPSWPHQPDPGRSAPITSITNLWGDSYWMDGRAFSGSKRDSYFRYLDLPNRSHQAFELAANIASDDDTGDRERFRSHGWRLVDPERVARTPGRYRDYIRRSRAELCCPKPIYRELRTGWFSDRSIAYLASGRPVVTEDTGFAELLPTGTGLLVVSDVEQAVEAVAEINADYSQHQAAARAIAEEFFDASKCLSEMLE